MASATFLEIGALLGIALMGGLLAKLLKQPVLVAYIIVGILSGPAALGIVQAEEEIQLLAKLGIAILLFLVGLKLDIHLIRAIGPVALLTGLAQVALTAALGWVIAWLGGWGTIEAIYIATAVTFSSTIIVVKLLGDRRELDQLHGRIAVGILIVQDILVVVAMLTIVTIGQPGQQALATEIALTLGGGVLFLAVVALASRFVLPRLLEWMASSQELTLVFGVAWAVALAAASSWLGLSMEIGAFVAGVALASTPYRESLGARMVSLRDIMILFFFVELGSSLTLDGAIEQLFPALILSTAILITKPLIVSALMMIQGYRSRVSLRTGLSLAQISEFSLILVALGYSLGQVGDDVLSLITLVAIITITLSTYLISYQDRILDLIAPLMARLERPDPEGRDEEAESHPYDAIVIGAGRLGSDIIRGLSESGATLLVVDVDPRTLKPLESSRIHTLHGDAGDPDFLKALPTHETQTVVCAIPDRGTNVIVLEALQRLDFDGSICLTALDRQTAETFAGFERVNVVKPFEMAARSIVSELQSRLDTPKESD